MTLTPPAQPTNATITGGLWATGPGQTQTSGELVEYAEYKQWATFDYTRNPVVTLSDPTNAYRSLVVLSAVDTHYVTGTQLHVNITIHNSCTILSGSYDNSSSYQAQKFALMANKSCKAGYTYGEVTGADNKYVFGPQGKILTIQPWIRRHPKTAADVPYHMNQYGTGGAVLVSGVFGDSSTYKWGKGDDIYQPYSMYVGDTDGKGWGYGSDICEGASFPYFYNTPPACGEMFGMIGGGYATSSEPGFGDNAAGLQLLITFINSWTNNISGIYPMRPNNPQILYSDGFGFIQEADKIEYNPYYKISRHDFT
jgi:hypothetical protein